MNRRLLIVAITIAFLTSGCALKIGPVEASFMVSTVETGFVDTDGTGFDTRLTLAPFSRLDAKDARLFYNWTPDGGGNIEVGEAIAGLDQTAQKVLVEALIMALKAWTLAQALP